MANTFGPENEEGSAKPLTKLSRRDFLRSATAVLSATAAKAPKATAIIGLTAAATGCERLPSGTVGIVIGPGESNTVKTPDVASKKRADLIIENSTGQHSITIDAQAIGVCAICLAQQFPEKNIKLTLGKCDWGYEKTAKAPWSIGIENEICKDPLKLSANMLYLTQLAAALEKEGITNIPSGEEQERMAHRAAFIVMAIKSAEKIKTSDPKFFENNPPKIINARMLDEMKIFWFENKDRFSIKPPSYCGKLDQIPVTTPTNQDYQEIALTTIMTLNGFSRLPFTVGDPLGVPA